jgi:hypothetical protein
MQTPIAKIYISSAKKDTPDRRWVIYFQPNKKRKPVYISDPKKSYRILTQNLEDAKRFTTTEILRKMAEFEATDKTAVEYMKVMEVTDGQKQ